MSDLQDVFPKLILKRERAMKSICSPLECLGIPIFAYGSVDADGTYVNLANFPEIEEVYYHHKLFLEDPYVTHPLLFRSGVISVPNSFNPNYMQEMFQRAGLGDALILLHTTEESLDFFFFGLPTHDKSPQKLLNRIDVLENFCSYFKREAVDIIAKARSENFNAKEVKGKQFTELSAITPLSSKDPQVHRFLTMISPLTKRERQCLELFKQGKTAQMTGALLGISQRTVEYYFDNIKNKLGCRSKSDLLVW